MMMTKKHFKAIAGIVKDYCEGDQRDIWALIYPLADFCGEENPRFNKKLFIDACTPQYILDDKR
jgi:hypothetical protein